MMVGSSMVTHAAEPLANRVSGVRGTPINNIRFPETTPDGRVVISVRLGLDPVTGKQAAIVAEQDAFISRCLQLPNAQVIGRATKVLNAVFLAIEEDQYQTVAKDPAVRRISPVANYRLNLSETVPYVGAASVQLGGVDGSGVRVAVIDSGVDYLHKDLSGSGDPDEFAANDSTVIEPGTFPTSKVVGGFDFVGPVWPNGPLIPDADPLDLDGHGTHVADIIGGLQGVAPGASIYALQACSSVSPSCAGVPLIQAIDFSADPNGDGDTSDHVDIINMSLGSDYGQPFDDDLAAAVENATRIGILTVASAGNGGDRPFVIGTPAAAASAIAVAQTQVPSAIQDVITFTAPSATTFPAVRQGWSGSLSSVVSGPIQYGDGAAGNLNGCAPFEAGALTGKIVMVDRGACFFSDKIRNIENAGGILGIIGLIAPGAAFPGAFGGGDPISIPGFMIDQSTADIIRAGGAEATFDPALAISLAGSMVSSSARGPRNGDNTLKPEIGAPGASISAETGTGVLTTPFGGTSGASPMVAGAAALLLSADPSMMPWEVKAKLMNSARTQVAQDFTGVDAPVSRIGAGELDVGQSYRSSTMVYNPETLQPKLDYGYVAAAQLEAFSRKLTIRNTADKDRTYTVSVFFREDADASSGAVAFYHQDIVPVAAHSEATINIDTLIFPENLPLSQMTSGLDGNNPANLSATEYDGYVVVEDDTDEVHVPWYMIPRKSAKVVGSKALLFDEEGVAKTELINIGNGPANLNAFSLMAISGDLPPAVPGSQNPVIDLKAVGVRTIAVPAGFCSDNPSFLIEVAFNTWDPYTHLLPIIQSAFIDVSGDGVPDYEFFNGDFALLGGDSLDGRSVSFVADLTTGTLGAFFFAEHATNTANTIITACAEQFGLTAEDLGTRVVTMFFRTTDFYFGGAGTDRTAPVTFTLGAERYTTVAEDIPAFDYTRLTVTDHGTAGPDLGVLVFTNGDRGATNRGGATSDTEALILRSRPLPEGF